MSRKLIPRKKSTKGAGRKQPVQQSPKVASPKAAEVLPEAPRPSSRPTSQAPSASGRSMVAARSWLSQSRFSRLADTSGDVWQRRAVRYLLLYSLLALVLLGIRSATYSVRPQLRQLQALEAELLTQKDRLEIEVQVATTPQRIAEWAESQGMKAFALMPKTPQPELSRGSVSPPVLPSPVVEVSTEWQP